MTRAPIEGGSTWNFVRHFLEMLLAMAVGMVALYPLLDLVIGPASSAVEVDSVVMATSMSVAMGGWMWFRGHGIRPILEMSVAMFAGFVVLFPFLWTGHVAADGVMVGGHVLMLLFMLVAMLARRDEYAGHEHATRRDEAVGQRGGS